MLTLILSILFWIFPNNKGLAISSIVLSVIGFVVDLCLYGFLAILDLIVLLVNLAVFNKHKNEYM